MNLLIVPAITQIFKNRAEGQIGKFEGIPFKAIWIPNYLNYVNIRKKIGK